MDAPEPRNQGGGADVNAKDNRGWTALIFATRGGHSATMHALLANGADVSAIPQDGRTVLLWAKFLRRADMVRLLDGRGGPLVLEPTPKVYRIKDKGVIAPRLIHRVEAEYSEQPTMRTCRV